MAPSFHARIMLVLRAGIAILVPLGTGLSGYAFAAPLDALLTTETHGRANELHLDLGVDAVNDTLDIFNIRDQDPKYAGTNVGDYKGVHLLVGYGLTEQLWVDAGFWRREISYRTDTETLNSWQAALQYRFSGSPDSIARYGVRIGAWGNEAGVLNKSTPTSAFNQSLDSISVNNPRDRQFQIDLIGSWKIKPEIRLGAFAGGGISQVDLGSITAGYKGCLYDIRFSSSEVSGTQVGRCGGLLSSRFTAPVTDDYSQGLAYSGHYVHAGVNLRWQVAKWTLKGGYTLQQLTRENVDDMVTRQGGTAYTRNNILEGELSHAWGLHFEGYARAEVMSNQFVGEIPFAYNAFTASKFGGKYGLLSLGLRATI
jgi:hypothetical protein